MKAAAVIPSRLGSTRLPEKALLRETGKFLVQHVWERAKLARRIDRVVVATDHRRIFDAVRSFGGEAVMTSPDHPSGTDRVAEVARSLGEGFGDVVVNVQGDEPQIDPADIDLLADLLREPGSDMATLAAPITDPDAYFSPNVVKVVCDDRGRAMYFSRSPIPMVRDGAPDFAARPARFLQHLGIYAYRRNFLLQIANAPPHPLEQSEKLEQLRVLGTGGTINVGIVAESHRGVDTPADYAEFVRAYRESGTRRAA